MIWHARVLLGLSKSVINNAKRALPQFALILPPFSPKWGSHEMCLHTTVKDRTTFEFTCPTFEDFDFEAFFLSNSLPSETNIPSVSELLTVQPKDEGAHNKAKKQNPVEERSQKKKPTQTQPDGAISGTITEPSLSQFFAANSLATVACLAAALDQLDAKDKNSEITTLSGSCCHEISSLHSVPPSVDETVPSKSTPRASKKRLNCQKTSKKRKTSRAKTLPKAVTESESLTPHSTRKNDISNGAKKASGAFLTYENPFRVLEKLEDDDFQVPGSNRLGKLSTLVDADVPNQDAIVEPTVSRFAGISTILKTPEQEDSKAPQIPETPESPESLLTFDTLDTPATPETTRTTVENSPQFLITNLDKTAHSHPVPNTTEMTADGFVLVTSKRSKHKNVPIPILTTRKQPFPIPFRNTPEGYRKASAPPRMPHSDSATKSRKTKWHLVQGKRGPRHSKPRVTLWLDLRSTNTPYIGPPSRDSFGGFSGINDRSQIETSPRVAALKKVRNSGLLHV